MIFAVNYDNPGQLTSDAKESSACCTRRRRNSFSSSAASPVSPTGNIMPRPGTMRLGPTAFATGNMAVIWAAGMPAFSISCVIAAPLRVLVPQVEVRITAST